MDQISVQTQEAVGPGGPTKADGATTRPRILQASQTFSLLSHRSLFHKRPFLADGQSQKRSPCELHGRGSRSSQPGLWPRPWAWLIKPHHNPRTSFGVLVRGLRKRRALYPRPRAHPLPDPYDVGSSSQADPCKVQHSA